MNDEVSYHFELLEFTLLISAFSRLSFSVEYRKGALTLLFVGKFSNIAEEILCRKVARVSTFGNFRKTVLPSLQQHRSRSINTHPSNFK